MAVCGNGVIEPGEICEPAADGGAVCPTAASCQAQSNQELVYTYNNNGTSTFLCDDTCTSMPRACSPTAMDGWCPMMCNSSNDLDCPPANDRCPNAMDITPGGVYPIDLPAAAKQNSPETCMKAGPDVFYTFTLDPKDGAQYIFLSALDSPITGQQVPLAIELYPNECPPPDGAGGMLECDEGVNGETSCRRNPFPLVTTRAIMPGKPGLTPHAVSGPLNPGRYFVAVRTFGGPGKWNLTYHHVPTPCVQQGDLVPVFGTPPLLQSNTCGRGNEYMPSCGGGEPGEDDNYLIYKCPSSLHVTTCDRSTALNTILSAVHGSMTYDAQARLCLPIAGSGKEVGCNNDIGTAGCINKPTASELSNIAGLEPGLVTISVDGDKGQCGVYLIGADYK
jgi:hypothetical protein